MANITENAVLFLILSFSSYIGQRLYIYSAHDQAKLCHAFKMPTCQQLSPLFISSSFNYAARVSVYRLFTSGLASNRKPKFISFPFQFTQILIKILHYLPNLTLSEALKILKTISIHSPNVMVRCIFFSKQKTLLCPFDYKQSFFSSSSSTHK